MRFGDIACLCRWPRGAAGRRGGYTRSGGAAELKGCQNGWIRGAVVGQGLEGSPRNNEKNSEVSLRQWLVRAVCMGRVRHRTNETHGTYDVVCGGGGGVCAYICLGLHSIQRQRQVEVRRESARKAVLMFSWLYRCIHTCLCKYHRTMTYQYATLDGPRCTARTPCMI